MFLNLSMVVIVLVTLYVMWLTYRNRKKLTCMAGMMIAMTVAMMASVSIGTFIGILQPELVSASIISVSLGMLAGYCTGKPISLMASIDGMLAGIMGGMMGAMLGVMVAKTNTVVMFIDVIFLFVIMVLIQMIHAEAGTKADGGIGNGTFLTIVLGIAIVGLLYYCEHHNIDSKNVSPMLGGHSTAASGSATGDNAMSHQHNHH